MGSVFLSYRREDSAGQARALFQDLAATLGKDAVFMDVDSIALGRDFREVLQERLATCDLMLVLIGREWLSGVDGSGRRRLDDPADFVRLEIAAALKRNIAITPVLLQGAQMPAADRLPENIAALAYRNGFELSHNRWESDVQELMRRLGLTVRAGAGPEGGARPTSPPGRAGGTRWLVVAAVALAVLAVVAASAFLYRPSDVPEAGAGTKQPDSAPATKNAAAPAAARPIAASTHAFDAADSQLRIDTPGSYLSSPFTVENLDPDRDFRLEFQVRSTRAGGSTRYGIAWNYSPEDFMLFTLHSVGGGFFSIGPGRSRSGAGFSRLAEGPVDIHAESGFDTLQITRTGSTLDFAVNGKPVWRTTDVRVSSRTFAFWVADSSEATIRSYTLRQ